MAATAARAIVVEKYVCFICLSSLSAIGSSPGEALLVINAADVLFMPILVIFAAAVDLVMGGEEVVVEAFEEIMEVVLLESRAYCVSVIQAAAVDKLVNAELAAVFKVLVIGAAVDVVGGAGVVAAIFMSV